MPGDRSKEPFLTLPTRCAGPLSTSNKISSWLAPDAWVSGSVQTHDDATPPNPIGFAGCGLLNFNPTVAAHVTTVAAETGTGADVNVDFNDEGLTHWNGLAESQTKKAVVTLPEGMTINPNGERPRRLLAVRSRARNAQLTSGEGCPNASKVGSLHVDTPIAEEAVEGSIFLAEQDDPKTTAPVRRIPSTR